jgi:hypothetical protein
MDWSPLLSTLLGATIGLGSAVVLERGKSARDGRQRTLDQRRTVYAEYLSALSRTRNEIRLAASKDSEPAEERSKQAREAFKEGGAYELRYQVALLAPEQVVSASDAAFRALRDVRDVVVAGAVHGEAGYVSDRDKWESRFAALREEMRRDLKVDQQDRV